MTQQPVLQEQSTTVRQRSILNRPDDTREYIVWLPDCSATRKRWEDMTPLERIWQIESELRAEHEVLNHIY